ncbi:hypothetical protein [Achromobacter sp. Root565]|uniref:hypothetical protein n=1 Tax=Achromobacter sp. Root565 TaxID=1736564 RepID=UPI0006FBD35C|nr:hypothetical protein [Achromobacter sp. Root565]KRA01284.1 hypothetical protein ASD71_04125 [Achromobacter sp. Root565]
MNASQEQDTTDMAIVLYTVLGGAECALTKAALAQRGLQYAERSAMDYAPALARKGYDFAPVVTVAVENELIAWTGHRPDLIELLADLLDTGLVDADGLRERDAAEEAVLTRFQVVLQLRDHQANAQEFFAEHGDQPLYRGRDLLNWLGY